MTPTPLCSSRVGRIAVMVGMALSSVACEGQGGDPATEPGTVAVELFSPGVISSELPEFATSFTPSGDTVFFNRTSADRSQIDLLYATRTPEGWSPPEIFAPLAGIFAIDPFVSLDGAFLYYSSDWAPDGEPSSMNLWRLPTGAADAVAERLPGTVNSDSSDVFNSIARDGRMVFSSRRDGERLVYETSLRDGSWTPPRRLVLGDGSSASNPAITPDGDLLVFARSVDGGAIDLWVTCHLDGEWGVPLRLPSPINSDFTEFAPGFGQDYLYFSSERPGVVGAVPEGVRPPGDIYRTRLGPIRALC